MSPHPHPSFLFRRIPGRLSPFFVPAVCVPFTNRHCGLRASWGNGQKLVIESFRGFRSRILYAR